MNRFAPPLALPLLWALLSGPSMAAPAIARSQQGAEAQGQQPRGYGSVSASSPAYGSLPRNPDGSPPAALVPSNEDLAQIYEDLEDTGAVPSEPAAVAPKPAPAPTEATMRPSPPPAQTKSVPAPRPPRPAPAAYDWR